MVYIRPVANNEVLSQQILIPTSVERQAVVRDNVGSLLCLGQVGEFDHRDRGHPQFACRQKPAVACDDPCIAVDEDRIRPAEFKQAGGDLCDLVWAVCSRVPLVGAEPVDGPVFQFSW